MRIVKQLLISVLLLSSIVNANEQAILLIEVENQGIQRFSAKDIQNIGLDIVGLQSKDLALFTNDQLIPLYISNLVDGKVTLDSDFEFIGSSLDNLYQKHTNYYLSLTNGLSIGELNLLSKKQSDKYFY